MADVKVGQVRRASPAISRDPVKHYYAQPFLVLTVRGQGVEISDLRGKGRRWVTRRYVYLCPLWPSEHEEYRNARGYEVKT